jgi:hypothetical protein
VARVTSIMYEGVQARRILLRGIVPRWLNTYHA